jgi:hypothetical protein
LDLCWRLVGFRCGQNGRMRPGLSRLAMMGPAVSRDEWRSVFARFVRVRAADGLSGPNGGSDIYMYLRSSGHIYIRVLFLLLPRGSGQMRVRAGAQQPVPSRPSRQQNWRLGLQLSCTRQRSRPAGQSTVAGQRWRAGGAGINGRMIGSSNDGFNNIGENAGQEGGGSRNMTDPSAQQHIFGSRKRVIMSRNTGCVLIMCHCRCLQGGGRLTD